jgi:hypothetical protein
MSMPLQADFLAGRSAFFIYVAVNFLLTLSPTLCYRLSILTVTVGIAPRSTTDGTTPT